MIKPYIKAGVPLVLLQTSDPAECIAAIRKDCANGIDRPLLIWDCVRGLIGGNVPGQAIADNLNQGQDPAIGTAAPGECLRVLQTLPELAVVLMINLGMIINEQGQIPTKQALWNLRDSLKTRGALVCFTAPLGTKLPADLVNDVCVLEIPLPTVEQHKQSIKVLVKDTDLIIDDQTIDKAVDAVCGLSGFAAEQSVALSISKSGIDLDGLWDRKRVQIEQTPGLSVWRGGDTFSDIGGCQQAKEFFTRLINGKRPPRAIVFLDEIEKQMAGNAGDLSGTSQAQFGKWLTHMQDTNAVGAMFIGPPGAAKSALAKAIGGEAGIPTIQWDMGDSKGGIVGETEAKTAATLATIEAVAQGRALWICTCNSIGVLPPELRRRFTLGTFFFDLPTAEERSGIWRIWLEKYGLKATQTIPQDEGWTGAEIRQCADKADRLSISLVDAATYVIPVSVSASESIETLRKSASGKYLSASYPGVYRYTMQSAIPQQARRMDIS